MSALLKTIAACVVIGLVGAAGLWSATSGGQAFTAEGARRLKALQAPEQVPGVILMDRNGRAARLSAPPGSVTLIEFIYTTCPTLCQSAGDAFSRLQSKLEDRSAGDKIRLLSVTFDPEHDGPAELKLYEEQHHIDGRQWRLVRPRPEDVKPLLDAFGVVVLPDPVFGFQHNTAIYIVNDKGRLVGIFDLDDIDGVLRRIAEVERDEA
jgi:protein SCO1